MTIFHSAALKLTAWYLSIIMLLSLTCSFAIYRLASDQLINNTQRQIFFFNDVLDPSDFRNYAQLRHRQLDQGLDRLKANLAVFNLLVLFSGGAASYALSRRTLRPIEESLETQKRFTADASHELRTPLTAMQMEIEVALRDKSLSKTAAIKQLRSNLEEVEKLRSLSEGLLRLAAGDSNQMGSEKVFLDKVAAGAIDRWSKTAASKKIKLHPELKSVTVRGDSQSLSDLVSIFLDNAIKYSPPGSEINIRTYKKGRDALISVRDNGVGIKREELPKIFERFYRSDASRSKTRSPGYGLGLSIAKKIVELHRGNIEVKSHPGKGSTFTVRLARI